MKRLVKTITIIFAVVLSSNLLASTHVQTVPQDNIRPSYPFPDFLSTGPYIWYEDTAKKHIKGHAFRVSTFTNNQSYRIYLEKVEFGVDGCCLEIVDYRQLMISEDVLKQFFPQNKGIHGFKLIRWTAPEIFEFKAYGGNYKLSNLSNKNPVLEELQPN